LATGQQKKKAQIFGRSLREFNLNLNFGRYSQTNPEGSARLTRRLIMDLVEIVIFETEYSMNVEMLFVTP
jgi:hypothetical protein